MTTLKNSESISNSKRSQIDKNRILNALKYYTALRNESISQETYLAWIDMFESLGFSTERAEIKIREAGMKKIYGKTTFDIFLSEEESYIDNELINMYANQKVWEILKQYGITPESHRAEYRDRLITQCIQADNEKLNQKLLTMGEKENSLKRELLIEILNEIPQSDYVSRKVIRRKIDFLK